MDAKPSILVVDAYKVSHMLLYVNLAGAQTGE